MFDCHKRIMSYSLQKGRDKGKFLPSFADIFGLEMMTGLDEHFKFPTTREDAKMHMLSENGGSAF